MIKKHLIPVSCLLSGLALPVPVALGAAGDTDRFASFADGARASGTLQMTLTYSGDPNRCAKAGTCGVSGTVVAKLRLDPNKRVHVRDGVAVLPVSGAASTTSRDTVAGHACNGHGKVTATGISFKGDRRGVLLRVGAALEDPFTTACRAPSLHALGESALPSVRLTHVGRGIDTLRLNVNATRAFDGGGYTGRLKTRGKVSLRG